MAIVKIPFTTDFPWWDQEVVIDNNTYTLEFKYNERNDYWSMSIYDRLQTLIIAGIRLTVGINLIARYALPEAPQGELLLVNIDKSYIRADSQAIGKQSLLFYNEVTV
jgi:hypothetical protein